jgi:NAD(P)-dependent dehydrogenase (short-subunit alcohol dehydrogenase family)
MNSKHDSSPNFRCQTGWSDAVLGLLGVVLGLFILSAGANAQGGNAETLEGKVVMITGSTDGLGREVAIRLGNLGAHVLVHGRNLERGQQVVDEINAGPGTARFYRADLGSLAEVHELASAVRRDHEELHILINNAGIGSGASADGTRPLSTDGHELVFQVNYLSHYLLTHELMPLIRAGAPSRIINVASAGQRPINFDDVMMEHNYNPSNAYTQSKLAQILFTFELADVLKGTQVTVNALHPASFMDTTLVRQAGAEPRSSVSEGADAVMNIAVDKEFAERTGVYMNGMREARANAQAYDHEARRKLDDLSRRLTGMD